MTDLQQENEKARRFFNRTALIYPIIERTLFPEYQRALRKLNLNPALTVLDIATGTGILASAFAERGHQVSGYDISEKMLRRAIKKHPGITFKHFNLTDLHTISDGSFNIVSMGYFLHGANPDFRLQVLKESARIASDKVIIFDYCCRGNWLVNFIEWLERSHYKQFTSISRADELKSANLEVEQELNLSDYGSVWVCKRILAT